MAAARPEKSAAKGLWLATCLTHTRRLKAMKITRKSSAVAAAQLVCSASMVLAASAQAGMATDNHGNVAYDTAAECDAAVAAGSAKFYEPFTHQPPLKRAHRLPHR
jgi:hypothetical protein